MTTTAPKIYDYTVRYSFPGTFVAEQDTAVLPDPDDLSTVLSREGNWYVMEVLRTEVEVLYTANSQIRLVPKPGARPENVRTYVKGQFRTLEQIGNWRGENSILYMNAESYGGAVECVTGNWIFPPSGEVVYI